MRQQRAVWLFLRLRYSVLNSADGAYIFNPKLCRTQILRGLLALGFLSNQASGAMDEIEKLTELKVTSNLVVMRGVRARG